MVKNMKKLQADKKRFIPIHPKTKSNIIDAKLKRLDRLPDRKQHQNTEKNFCAEPNTIAFKMTLKNPKSVCWFA
jgi:hypothetical protein